MIRTVHGDIPARRLGRTNYHEHLFQITPLLPGDELDDETRSGEEAASLRAAGMRALVEATPIGLGRDPAGTRRIAESADLHIVLTTGAHREVHYHPEDPLLRCDESELARLFRTELTEGAADPGGRRTDVRAGLLKAGIGYWSITPFEHRVLAGVAAAHRSTGAPVMVHLEHGSAAFEVLAELAAHGVAAESVALAHIDRNPDPGLHAELASTGAYLGYDGMARHREHPDSTLLDCLVRTARAGGVERILLGGDVARSTRYRAYGGMPGMDYLPLRFVPRLTELGGTELVETVLVANPARWLSWRGDTPK